MDNAPEVYFRYALTPSRRMTYVGPAVHRLTGYTPEHFLADARLCRSVVALADRHRLRELARGRRGSTATLQLQRADGGTVDVQVRTIPVIRARRIVAIEGVVSLLHSTRAPIAASDNSMPEPVQQRLAALLYEVHGLLHRHGIPVRSAAAASPAESMLLIGDISLDAERMTVTMAGRRVELTSRELLLLRYLAQRRGRVVTRPQILQDVWGYQYAGDDRTVDVHISRLRRKLPSLRGLLRAVKHVGYRLETAEVSPPSQASPRRIANS
jgi:DNA-binding winged helix-turn-helix (wHTH) protein